MQFLTFILVYPLIWFVSILPFRIIYFISDVLCFLLYHVIRYRRKVIQQNLQLVFPEKTPTEISQLVKKHYCHFTDLLLETVKTLSISEKELNKRLVYKNTEVLRELYRKQKSVLLICGHYGNWEWLGNMEKFMPHKGHAVYKPAKNNYFNNLIYTIRARFGAVPIDKNNIIKTFVKNQKEKILGLYLMVADQSPKLNNTRYWTSFLGVKVPVFVGTEVLAKKVNAAVVFLNVTKRKRGYYEASFKLLEDYPEKVPNYTVTDSFLRALENQIYAKPEYYFWTHKRFKHRDKVPEMFCYN